MTTDMLSRPRQFPRSVWGWPVLLFVSRPSTILVSNALCDKHNGGQVYIELCGCVCVVCVMSVWLSGDRQTGNCTSLAGRGGSSSSIKGRGAAGQQQARRNHSAQRQTDTAPPPRTTTSHQRGHLLSSLRPLFVSSLPPNIALSLLPGHSQTFSSPRIYHPSKPVIVLFSPQYLDSLGPLV
ncbi:hypothetical protein F5Y08DRAFT_133248 [Xylaria arbuscula]|nr:hypothetical protein F5Y08DRAFT_133248 [Xylaria arbuscula]